MFGRYISTSINVAARRALATSPLLVILVAGILTLSIPTNATANLEADRTLIAQGKYKEAITSLESTIAKDSSNEETLALLLRAKLAVGDYRKALAQGLESLKKSPSVSVAEVSAELAMNVGEYEQANSILEKIASPKADWLRGQLANRRGDTAAARAFYEKVAGILNRARPLSGEELSLAASALAEMEDVKQANSVFREAIKADPKDSSIRSDWGMLMARKHNPADAEGLFKEALEINPNDTAAMTGMMELEADRWDGGANKWTDRIFAVNRNYADAHLLFVRMSIEQDEFGPAEEHLGSVLSVNPNLLEAWSMRAVIDYIQAFLRGNNSPGDVPVIAKILKENPHYGQVFSDLGDFCILKHQEPEAIEFYRRAIALDPRLDDARSNLGINLFRVGKEQEARTFLEEAYKRDPFNVSTVNTLRLMDSFEKFDRFETPHFSVMLQKKESELLHPYVEALLEETIQNLMSRYPFKVPGKVTFEMYPDHEDFAVRTVGLPGLGALGATLHDVVVMDSPSARAVGAFHWGSTLWHEMAHVISLGMTNSRVPRWFTEGLSVYEENHSHPGWGDPVELELIRGVKEGKLLPIENLNSAFVRPKYPNQMVFAYYEGGMICDFIVTKYGFPKIVAMLNAYAKGLSDGEAIKQALGMTMEEFDEEFMAFAKEQTYGFAEALDFHWAMPGRKPEELAAEVKENPGNYFAQLYLAMALEKDGKHEEAIEHANVAKTLFPPYTGHVDPYTILADAYVALGQKDKAIDELMTWRNLQGRSADTFKKLANLLKDAGRTDEAIRILEDGVQISIFDLWFHEELGNLYMERTRAKEAVREFQAVLTLKPPDLAGAHYNLASAYRSLADNGKARQQVLAALEVAPGYRPAQKLLLELTGN